MKKVFVGTLGWIALVNTTDSFHSRAKDLYIRLLADGYRFITHQRVMLEIGNGFSAIQNRPMAIGLQQKLQVTDHYELINLNSELYEAAWKLFEERSDKNWGIVDCLSFVIMNQFGITEALTTDRHFEQAGFIKLL